MSHNLGKLPLIAKRKLLQRLSQAKYFVSKTKDTSPVWFLWESSNNNPPTPQYIVPTNIIDDLFSEGILLENKAHAHLTKAGRIYIRRQLTNGGNIDGQHQDLFHKVIEKDGLRKTVLSNSSESPLSWLAKRKDKNGAPMIDQYQFASGERLRANYEKGLMAPQVTRNWDRLSSSISRQKSHGASDMNASEASLVAKQNFSLALDAVGPELSGVLLDVCCEQRGLEDAEKRNGWPKRSGKIILGMALTRLARHYGFIPDNHRGKNHPTRIGHWGAEDYRPIMDG